MKKKTISGQRVVCTALAASMALSAGTPVLAAEVTEEPNREDFVRVDEEAYEEAKNQYEAENPAPVEDDFVGAGETTEEYQQDVTDWENERPVEGDYITDTEGYDQAITDWEGEAPAEDDYKEVDTDAFDEANTAHEAERPTEENFVDNERYEEAQNQYAEENPAPSEDDFQVDDEDAYNEALTQWQEKEPNKDDYVGDEYKAAVEAWEAERPTEDSFKTDDEDAYNEAVAEHETQRPANEGFDTLDNEAFNTATTEHTAAQETAESTFTEQFTVVDQNAYNEAVDVHNAAAPSEDIFTDFDEESYMEEVEANATEAKPDVIESTDMSTVELSDEESTNLNVLYADAGGTIVSEDSHLISIELVKDAYSETDGAVADPYNNTDLYLNNETTYTQHAADTKAAVEALAATVVGESGLDAGKVATVIDTAIYFANDSSVSEEERFTNFIAQLSETVSDLITEETLDADEASRILEAITAVCTDASALSAIPNLTSSDFTCEGGSNLSSDFIAYFTAASEWGWAQDNKMDYVDEDTKAALDAYKTGIANFRDGLTVDQWREVLTEETLATLEEQAMSDEAFKALFDAYVQSANVDVNQFKFNNEGTSYADALAEHAEAAPSIGSFTTFDEDAYNAALEAWLAENPAPVEGDFMTNEEGKSYAEVLEAWAASAPKQSDFVIVDTDAFNTAIGQWEAEEPEDTTDYTEYDNAVAEWEAEEPQQSSFTKLDAEAFKAAHDTWAQGAPNASDFVDADAFQTAVDEWAALQPKEEDFLVVNEDAYNTAVEAWEAEKPSASDFGLDTEVFEQDMIDWESARPNASDYDSIAFGAAQAEWLANYPITDDFMVLDDEAYQQAVKDYQAYLESLVNQNKPSSSTSSSSSSSSTASPVVEPTAPVEPVTFSTTYLQAKPRGTEVAPEKIIITGSNLDITEYASAMEEAIVTLKATNPGTAMGTMFLALCEWTGAEFQAVMNNLDTCTIYQQATKTVDGKATDAYGNTIYRYGNFEGGCAEAVCILMGTTEDGRAVFSQGRWDENQQAYVTIFTEDIVTMTAFVVAK